MSDLTLSINKKFLAGMLTVTAVESLQQDWWGLEGTIRHVVSCWMSWKITVPLAVLSLAWAAYLYIDPISKKDGTP